MIEYRTPSFAKRNHEVMGDYWSAWHTNQDKIQRRLFDEESFLLATETLEGDVADLLAFARAGGHLTTHRAEVARKLVELHDSQTRHLLSIGSGEPDEE